MTFCKKRSFFLDNSLHSRLFKVTTSGLGRERLVDDIMKDSGNLDSILNLPRADKTLGITDISGRKLHRSTTSGLWKVREVFGAKSSDGAIAHTSGR